MNRRLAIVQDYVPQYRVGFFSRLVVRLRASGIECVVVAGPPPRASEGRHDRTSPADWVREVGRPWEFPSAGRGPRIFGYGTDRYWRDCDGVIMGLRGAAIDLHLEILRKRFTHRRLGVWGHLSRFVNPPNPLDIKLERWQMAKCDHVFAYTDQGRRVAIASGISSEKVTSVMNSLDVSELIGPEVTPDEFESFVSEHSLPLGKTFAFIGGVDESKRVAFLAEVLDLVWRADPEVKLLLAGRGDQETFLRRAILRGQVVPLGYVGARVKALSMKASQALVNPGRIGLIAVESLAVGIPILATEWDFHAPEFDYLEVGRDVLISRNDPSSFAELVIQKTNTGNEAPLHVGKSYPTIGDMVSRFASGVEAMFRD